MADYHFVYKDVEGASTQWDDIQRKLGNLLPNPSSLPLHSVSRRRFEIQRQDMDEKMKRS
uniref:Uncharacterized protein n=1 Tax=Nelumbo nucifera TaxID=4432 RepID=A0A822XBQ9_NELNU|nr:TPA_asm: hypothetical protein HUJ06_019243 [Nelumbo nucifera]